MSTYSCLNVQILISTQVVNGVLYAAGPAFGQFNVAHPGGFEFSRLNEVGAEFVARMGGTVLRQQEEYGRETIAAINNWIVRIWLGTGMSRDGVSWEQVERQLRQSLPSEAEVIPNQWDQCLASARQAGFDPEALRRLSYRVPINFAPGKNEGRELFEESIAALEAGRQEIVLALLAGVEDKGYNTVRWGYVDNYAGSGVVVYPDGRRFRVTGFHPRGNPQVVTRRGYIRWEEIK